MSKGHTRNKKNKNKISIRIKEEITNKKYGRFGFFDEFIRYCYWLLFMMLNVFVLFEIKRPFGLEPPLYIWAIIFILFLIATYLEYLLYRKIWQKKENDKEEKGKEEKSEEEN